MFLAPPKKNPSDPAAGKFCANGTAGHLLVTLSCFLVEYEGSKILWLEKHPGLRDEGGNCLFFQPNFC